jgi:tetratricopeptide (TPR) repeat protein
MHDYDRALQLDPTLGAALLGRSALSYRQGRYAAALADLRRAAELDMDPAIVSYDRALIHLAQHEPADALANLQDTLRRDPSHAQAKALLDQLQDPHTR